MKIPKRIQRKRTKGYKSPPGTRYVGRGTEYGNLYRTQKYSNEYAQMVEHHYAVACYEWQMKSNLSKDTAFYDDLLNYKFISCFCPMNLPCHCDPIIKHLEMRYKILKELR